MLNFESNPVGMNIGLFVFAAIAVWFAGTRLSHYADAIADKTGINKGFIGLVVLAAATELPEFVTTITAVSIGNAQLAINNMFGGIVLQTAILAVADAVVGRRPLSQKVPDDTVLLQGTVLIILLGIATTALSTEIAIGVAGISVWSIVLLVVYVVGMYVIYRAPKQSKHWKPPENSDDEAAVTREEKEKGYESWSLGRLALFFGGVSVVILIAGYVLSRTADMIADQSGLGSSFIGATLLASSTSLPELSTSITAARLGNYSMAIGNIFGSNSIMLLLIFVSDVTYREGSILLEGGRSALVASSIGVIVTGIYLAGMLERRDRTILRLGVDSWLVLFAYAAHIALLYVLGT